MRVFLTTVLVMCVMSVAGCNTIKGLGKDVSKAGEKIEKASGK